jgi:hypothetical protein
VEAPFCESKIIRWEEEEEEIQVEVFDEIIFGSLGFTFHLALMLCNL